MADEILLSLDAEATSQSVDELGSRAASAALQVGKIETRVKAVNAELKKLDAPIEPRVLSAVSTLLKAVSGGFSESAFKLAALQGKLREFEADSLNITNRIYNAQTAAYGRLASAVKEARIASFQANPQPAGSPLSSDPTTISLQIQAEQRRANSATATGGTADVARLNELEAQLVRINAQRQAGVDITNKGLQTEALQRAALSEAERARLEVQRQTAVVKATALLGDDKALAEAEAQLRVAKETLATTRQSQGGPADPFASTRERFSLNGGADLFKVQTQLLANYQIVTSAINLIRNGAGFVVDFEAQLKQLQAIAGATDEEIAGLGQRFIELSQRSKFSAPEITGASVVLAQAGLSPSQIGESIESIIRLATATGTDLKVAVDIATTVMTVFNVRATEMGNVANIVTAALNQSKLDAEKLALGLQYAGNVAADVGVNFVELVTALSAMSNAGVKSGSTLGSGLREILEALVNPSAKLQATMHDLGVTMSDIDIRTHGVFGVMQNLRDAGFSTADALRDFGLRGASAFAALNSQASGLNDLQQAILLTGDAAQANATQMDTIAAQYKRLGSAAGGLAATGFAPLMGVIKGAFSGFADFITVLSEYHNVLKTVVTLVSVGATLAFAKWFGSFAIGLLNFKGLAAELSAFTTLAYEAITGVEGMASAFSLLGKATPWLAILTVGLTAAIELFGTFGKSSQTLEDSMSHVQTGIDESKGKVDAYNTTIIAITEEMQKLADRHTDLSKNGEELQTVILELNNRFRDMGFYVDAAKTNVDGLTHALEQLRHEQRQQLADQLQSQALLVQNQQLNQEAKVREQFGYGAAQEVTKKSGLGFFLGADNDYVYRGVNSPEASARTSAISALDFISGSNAPVTPEDYTQMVAAFRAQIKDLTAKRAALGNALTGDAAAISKGLGTLIDALNTKEGELLKSQGLAAQLKGTQKQADNAQFEAGPVGDAVSAFVQENRVKLGNLKASYSGIDGDGNRIPLNDDAQRKYAQGLADFAKQYVVDLDLLTSTLTDDQLKQLSKSSMMDTIKSVGSDVRGASKAQDEAVDKIDAAVNQRLADRIKANISALMAKVNDKTPTGEVAGLSSQIEQQYKELGDVQVKLNDIRQRQSPGASSEVEAHTDEIIRETNKIEMNKDLDRIHSYLSDAAHKASEAVNPAKDLARAVRDFTSAVKVINEAYRAAVDAAKAPVDIQNAKIAGLSLRNNGNAYNISDVQRQVEQDKLEELQKKADQAVLDAQQTRINDLAAQIAALQDVLDRTTDHLTSVGNSLGGDLSASERTDLQTQNQHLLTTRTEVTNKLAEATQNLTGAQEENAKSLAEFNAKNAAAIPMSLGDSFNAAVDQWRQQAGVLKSTNAWLADSFKGVFSSASDGLSQFVQDVATKTKTIGQAFKDMIATIVQSMLKIASDKLATSLLSSAFSFLGAGLGGADGAAPAMGTTSETSPFIQGGAVRAAHGMLVRGKVRTRDSVHVLAQPGEFINTQSTVQALGPQFFHSLNATGGGSLLTAMASMAGAGRQEKPREPDKVNVWVVQEKPPASLGPKDVVALVARDLSTGGATKRLVKSIAMGTS